MRLAPTIHLALACPPAAADDGARQETGSGWRSALLVALLAVLARATFLVQAWGTPLLRQHERVETDMGFFWEWSRQIAAGDLLGRQPLHPWHGWHDVLARQAHALMGEATPYTTAWGQALWNEWYGGLVFHQEPLYAYFLAALSRVADMAEPVVLAQATMGVASSLLVWAIGRRAFGSTAGLVGGALAALHGPAVFYEGLLLRGPLEGLTLLLALWAAQRTAQHPTVGTGVVTGLSLALATLTRATALPLTAVVLVSLALTGRGRTRAAVGLLSALLLGLSPLIARNLSLDLPPLALTGLGAVAVAVTNTADFVPGSGFAVSPQTTRILLAHHDSTLEVGRACLETFPSVGVWLGFVLEKARVLLSPLEIPNNVSYRWYARALSWPRLGTWWVLLPAVGGMILSLRRWRQALLLLAFAAVALAPAVAFYNLSRFRTPAVFLLAPFAGLAVARLLEGLRRRKLAEPAVVLGAALLVASLGYDPVTQPIREIRATDVATQGSIFLAQARTQLPADGLATVERALAAVPDDDWVGEPARVADAARQITTDLWEACARLAHAAGDEDRARACFATWKAR